ncbi:MAG: hypothetical protein AAF957_05935 [Planctomycetota bacterium]
MTSLLPASQTMLPTLARLAPLALAPLAAAQSAQSLSAPELHATTPARYAGIYHAATGTWSRPSATTSALNGIDVIYSNTAQAGYFTTAGSSGGFAPGSTNFDEGGIPGTTNGDTFPNAPDRDEYRVNGFQIGYCDFGPPLSSGWEISFYSSHVPCTLPSGPAGTVTVTGLPAGGGCWVIDIDLTGGEEFNLAADGGAAAPGWDNDPNMDSFGWGFAYAGSSPGTMAGFQLAGDPMNTDPGFIALPPRAGTNTYFGPPSSCGPDIATGYLTADLWWLEDPATTNTGCYFFGGYTNSNGCGGPQGNPYASFQIEIRAEADAPKFGTIYCNSNPNSTGSNTGIVLFGSSTAADDDVMLIATDVPAGAFGFFFTSQDQGFVANPGGSEGNLCLGGAIGRFVAPGQVKAADIDGLITLDTNLGEWTLTELPTPLPPLSYPAVTGLTSNFQLWHRDAMGGTTVSNFSDGISVTWD